MDLRKYNLSAKQIDEAVSILNYQPFIISDDICTGVAYSWLYTAEGGRNSNVPDFVLDRRKVDAKTYAKFCNANAQLRAMYDDFIDVIVKHFKSGTLLDVACNNGYFIVRAMEKGMATCVGYDMTDYSKSVSFLNKIVGTHAEFIHTPYDSFSHTISGCDTYDVVIACNIMQHISDPLYFLAFLGSRAKKGLLLFTGMGNTDQYLVYYSEPNRFNKDSKFPVCFDNDVGISRGLLYKSLELMGFHEIIEIPRKETWLPKSFLDVGCQKALLCLR